MRPPDRDEEVTRGGLQLAEIDVRRRQHLKLVRSSPIAVTRLDDALGHGEQHDESEHQASPAERGRITGCQHQHSRHAQKDADGGQADGPLPSGGSEIEGHAERARLWSFRPEADKGGDLEKCSPHTPTA